VISQACRELAAPLALLLALAGTVRAEVAADLIHPRDPDVRAGDPRTLEEGTWGMDYCGRYLPHRVWLNWYHGRVAQGGSGRYATDGPHFLQKAVEQAKEK
jgi:hypothetical protein